LQYKWVVLSVTTIGILMAQIDNRIVIVGLPTIGRELGIGLSELVWVTQVYVLVSTIAALLLGRVSDVIGRVKLFTIGFAIFTLGSALGSLAFSGEELIAARAVQGIGSALLISNSSAMLTDAAKGEGLGTLLGINSVIGNLGGITGLTLSGVILAVTDWRALFYINIPFGIFGTWWAHKRLHEINIKDPHRKMDWGGFLSFVSSLSFILLSLTFLSYGLTDEALGLSLLGSGLILLGAFVWFERRAEAPLLDLELFKIRRFAFGNMAMILNGIPFFGMSILVSLSIFSWGSGCLP
jgi:MFS family permease